MNGKYEEGNMMYFKSEVKFLSDKVDNTCNSAWIGELI